MVNSISLNAALELMDEKTVGGKANLFQISFFKEDGELVEIDNAVKCGTKTPQKRYIGVRTTNNKHHPFAVHINLIYKYNNLRVTW